MRIDAIPEKYGVRVHSDDKVDIVFLRFQDLEKGNGERKHTLNNALNLSYHGNTLVVFHEADGNNPAFSITEHHIRRRLMLVHRSLNIGDALGSAMKLGAEYPALTKFGIVAKKLDFKNLRGVSICNYKIRHSGTYADTIKDMAPDGWERFLALVEKR
ncbi:hypothetical protein HYS95_03595 [Candidatus Daviesbacteria bacterium]|nr:hypothetical protein [Candidatus Daviesbacteria bacterium]